MLGLGPGEAWPHIGAAWPGLAQQQPQDGHMCYLVAQMGQAGLLLFKGEVSSMETSPGDSEGFALPPLIPYCCPSRERAVVPTFWQWGQGKLWVAVCRWCSRASGVEYLLTHLTHLRGKEQERWQSSVRRLDWPRNQPFSSPRANNGRQNSILNSFFSFKKMFF